MIQLTYQEKLKTARRLVGTVVSNDRKEQDFYPTPKWATEALLDREIFIGSMWEPACGDGAISEVLKSRGFTPYSSDLINRGYPCDEIDFFETNAKFDNIITNPPFSLCTEFILKSKQSANSKIAMFLKTTALEGNKRHKMWIDTEFPFARIYQFVNRVSFGKSEGTHKSGGMMAFAWFVWDKNHIGSPTISWIK